MSKIPALQSSLFFPCNRLLGKGSSSKLGLVALAGLVLSAVAPSAKAASGTWTLNGAGNWSGTANWAGGVLADGVGTTADFSKLDITAARTVTIDTTSRTVGNLLIGDSGTATLFGYTITASGGASLIFDNGGSGALLSQVAGSGANSFSAPFVLNDNLSVVNSATSTLTISGSTTGTKNLALNANDAGAITVSGSIITSGTVTNSGTGVGLTTISGVIGPSVAGVVQNSANSQLTLSGANTFTSGVLIKSGTLLSTVNSGLGSGTVTIGDSVGTANATLLLNSATFTNAIVAQGSGSNALSIVANGNVAARPNGNILLNSNLTLVVNGGGQTARNTGSYLASSGTISGTGNLTLNVSGNGSTTNNGGNPQMDSLVLSGPVTTSGTIFNTGTGSGRTNISGNITSASGLNQNSATSMLTLSGSNSYSGATLVNAGVLRVGSTTALSANSNVTVASGATVQVGFNTAGGPVLNLSGTGTSYSNGALEGTSTGTYSGAIVLTNDTLIGSDLINGTPSNFGISGGITGSGRNLTMGGSGNIIVSGGAIATGSGSLTKVGSGLLTLSSTNSFTGLTTISGGGVYLNSTGALNGGGNITFDGGFLRSGTNNLQDLGSRVVNSTSSISLDTNAQSVTFSNSGSTNTGGLTKLGLGQLTLSGTNTFSGPIAVNGGVLAVSATTALPSLGTGLIYLDKGGALKSGGAYANVQAWLNSNNIASSSTGVVALAGNSSENIDFTGYGNLGLGASAATTYTGTITPAGNTYRLGGGGAVLTLSAANTLSGTSALVVSSGSVNISNSNNMSGATTVNGTVLTLSATGALANSDLTVNSGATLAVTANTATTAVTRVSSVTLSRGTLTLTGNTTANSTDVITNALAIGAGGNSLVSITPGASKNTLFTANSLTRSAGGVALIRGTSLGLNSIASQTANSVNISVVTPNLVGGSGTNTTDGGILVGFVGDTSTGGTGTGYGATGGLLTSDTTSGVRLLTASEYSGTIADGQAQLDNVRLTGTSGALQTTTLNTNTTINSLSIKTSGAAGSAIQVAGTGTLTLNSGVLYSTQISPAVTAAGVSNNISFNSREGIVLASGTLNLSGALTNTGSNGLTFAGPGRTVLSGAGTNTYTGTTTVNAGTLELAKTPGVNAITGDLVINTGATVTLSGSNQIADSANVSVNGGSFLPSAAETINNLSVTNAGSTTLDTTTINGSLSISGTASVDTTISKTATVVGALNLSDGGNINIKRSQNITGTIDTILAVGSLNITNQTTGAYTALTFDTTGGGLPQSGGKLTLNGDVTFTGNSTNTNTVLIDATKGSGRQGTIELNGTRIFDIGNGAAKVDLRITAPLTDGASTGGLTKNGAGTLDLTGASIFTGSTTVNAGTLLINGSSVSAVTVAGGALGGTGSVANSVSIGNSGTLAAGNGGIGTLSTGNISLSATASTIAMEIGGTGAGQYDQVNVTGGVNLNGNGQIALSLVAYTPVLNALFFPILNDSNDAINGTLFGLAQGATFSAGGYLWQVSYTGDSVGNTFTGGNDLALQVVPEPSTWALLGCGAMMLLIFRRRLRS